MKNASGNNGESAGIWRQGTLTYTTAGLVALFCWLLWGDFTWAMKDRAIGPSATLLFKSFGYSDFVYALICVAFPSSTNIILCPVISYISDRHRGRLGRRIPFLIFTTPFIVAGLIGLGFTPMLGTWIGETFSLASRTGKLIAFGIFWVLLDFGTTLAGALSTALVNDVVPSRLLGRFFGMFRAVSLLAGMIFNYFLIGKVETHSLYIFVGVGLLYGLGLSMMCAKVKEGEYPPVEERTSADARRIYGPVITYFRQSFSVGYYRWVIAALVLAGFTASPFNMFSIFYAKSIHMDMTLYGRLIACSYAVSFVLSYFLGAVADRFHPLRATLGSLVIYFGAMLLGWLVVCDARTFGAALIVHVVLSGCYFTLSASLAARLFPRKLFAQFNSALSMIAAITNVIMGPLLGRLLDVLGRNYRYTFLFGMIATGLAVLLLLRVYFCFLKYGGDGDYAPPDPNGEASERETGEGTL